MRNLIVITTLLLFAAGNLAARTAGKESPPFERHFSLKMMGGMAHLGKGDWKRYDWTLPDGRVDGEKLKWGWDGGLEVRYHFHPEYSLAIGIDRFWGRMDYADDMLAQDPAPGAVGPMVYSDRGWIESRAVPLSLTIYGNSLSYPLRTYAGLGLGYYFSTVSWYSDTFTIGDNAGTNGEYRRLANLSSGAVGAHWVLGWQYSLSRTVALAAELNGRHARISGYQGNEKRKERNKQESENAAELLFYEAVYETESGELRAGQLSVGPDIVWSTRGGSRYSRVDSRKAVMDFSGFSFKLGMAYHF